MSQVGRADAWWTGLDQDRLVRFVRMTSAVRGFGPSGTLRGSRLLLMGAVCGLIVPCMAGLALSQKLRRWPVGEANFRVW